MDFLLYGAYGYTGQLIAEMAVAQGLRPLLSGRSEEKLRSLAERLSLPYETIDLADTAKLEAALAKVPVVLHSAGPFAHTFHPMVQACLRTQTHYLDITGEMAVFEAIARMDKAAKAAGVMLLPGAGFDVVPTDSMAAFLAEQLPDATHLELAFHGNAGLSHGTAKTAIENIDTGGMVRENGQLKQVPTAHKVREIQFSDQPRSAVAIPWGDVATAWYTTQIPNILVYVAQAPKTIRIMKMSRYLSPILSLGPVQKFLKRQIEKRPAGPSAEKRAKSQTIVWGEVRRGEEKTVQARLMTPEGYTLTALASLALVQKVRAGEAKPGFQTPAGAYGYDWLLDLEGVGEFQIV
ncbi:MAG: saccharopine dehydrogenase NADP-binding domain-containing protein [Bacteroidota bacterium]